MKQNNKEKKSVVKEAKLKEVKAKPTKEPKKKIIKSLQELVQVTAVRKIRIHNLKLRMLIYNIICLNIFRIRQNHSKNLLFLMKMS